MESVVRQQAQKWRRADRRRRAQALVRTPAVFHPDASERARARRQILADEYGYGPAAGALLARCWRISRGDDGLVLESRVGRVRDRGSIDGDKGTDLEIRAMLELAQLKGWTKIQLARDRDFKRRAPLAALVPGPRVNLTPYHGVFAPKSPHRVLVPKARRGKCSMRIANGNADAPTPTGHRASMSRAQGLKRVFRVDIEARTACGGTIRIVCIGDPMVIETILAHLHAKVGAAQASRPPLCRAPPVRAFG